MKTRAKKVAITFAFEKCKPEYRSDIQIVEECDDE